jgi:hypothetical protein
VVRCTVRGYAVLQASNDFQWSGAADEGFGKLIAFVDRGLSGWPPNDQPDEPATTWQSDEHS